MFVLTIDQQDSRSSDDAVPRILDVLSPIDTVVPFARTIGDEVQGVLDDPDAVAEAVRRIGIDSGWHIGIGIGEVERPLPETTIEGRGAAFYAARQAVEAAKSAPANLVVSADPDGDHRGLAEAALRLLISTLAELRSHSRGYVGFRLDHPDATQAEIAAEFDVSQQAVSRVLSAGPADIVAGAERLARHHLAQHHLAQSEGAAHVD
ncbi:MAG TPA: SatD family protein [Brevibacterium epidermidis]|uniref:SatD family protein n=1 Tax=Brevibacterium epidermidis TaxID=1698 RepID=A0A9D2UN13_BREEP|nr:SatD family protein [Brevibacterium epidermidis]